MRIILSMFYIVFPLITSFLCFNKRFKDYKDSIYWGSLFLNMFLWYRTFPYIAQIEDIWKTIAIIGIFLFMTYEIVFFLICVFSHKK